VSLGVLASGEKFEILRMVVKPNPVSMVDVFPGDGVESVLGNHNQPMDAD
jgi:hypothetical protein